MVFAINNIVDTKLGKGKIVEIIRNKEDNNKTFVKVELSWELANNQKAYLYVMEKEINKRDNDANQVNEAGSTNEMTKPKFIDYFRILWPAILCVFIDFLGLAIAIPILPYFILELGWERTTECPTCPNDDPAIKCGAIPGCGTPVDVGALGGCFSIGQLIGNIIMGRVSDKIGRKPIIMLSLLMSAVGYLLCGISQTLGEIYVYRLFSGLAGGTMPVAISMILDTVQDPAERPKFFGLAGASIGMAFTIGPVLGVFAALAFGKRAGFFVPTAIATIILCMAFFRVTETHPSAGILGLRPKWMDEKFGVVKKSNGKAAKMPKTIYHMFLSFFFGSMAFGTFNSMCALVFLSLMNWGTTEVGLFLFAYGIVNIPLAANSAKILEKMQCGSKSRGTGYLNTLYGSGFLLALYLAIFSYVANTFIQFLLMILLLPAAMSAKNPSYNSIVGLVVPVEQRGAANGLVSGAMSIGMGLAPFIAGPIFVSDVLKQTYTYGSFSHLVFWLGAFCAFMEFFIIATLIRPVVLSKEKEAEEIENKKKNKTKLRKKRDSLVVAKERKERNKGKKKEKAPSSIKIEIID